MWDASDLITLIAGLVGAVIGGAISLVGQWISAEHQERSQRREWAEERSRWAAERRLVDFKDLLERIETLKSAVVKFRIRKAHERRSSISDHAIPEHVASGDEARSGFEEAVWSTRLSILLLEAPFENWATKIKDWYFKWYIADDEDEGIEVLLQFEAEIEEFRHFTADQYKLALTDRGQPKGS